VQEPDRPGLSLDQGADRRALVFANDEIALPMPGLGPVQRIEGPLADGEYGLLEPPPSPFGVLVRATVIASMRSRDRWWGASGDGRINGDPGR
jgi:hypothetical protein